MITDAERRAQNERLLRNIAAAAEAESAEARAREWRGASPERHAEVLEQVLALSDAIQRGRPVPATKEPLNYPRIPGRPSRLCR